jgi:serine/threonine-protein kinase
VLGRQVALKRPRADQVADADSRHRFMREARVASCLSHPNIVPIFEVFEENDVPWIAMQFVEGTSLRTVLSARGPLPLEDILTSAEALTGALQAAHASNVIHRDINPNNVIIASDGRALLTDFGLARFFLPAEQMSSASTQSTDLTAPGAILGTPGYMSPEQILGRRLDARSDIFSLGTVLYEMCTARPAFRRSEAGDITDAILNREPEAIHRLNYEIPEELERIARKALAKRIDERYQSAQEMHADLAALHRRIVSGSVEPTPVTKPERPGGARTVIASLATAAVVAVVAIALWWLWLRSAPPQIVVEEPLRPSIAVLPFEDRIGDADSSLRVRMVADLLAADLGESKQLRSVATERVDEIVAGMAATFTPSALRAQVPNLAAVNWLIDGSLYQEDGNYLLKADIYPVHAAEPFASFHVEAGRPTALVDLATARIRKHLSAESGDAGNGDPGAGRLYSESEDARILEYGARQALREKRYLAAIHALERAVEIDPRFLLAHGRLAHALDRAGYGHRARQASARAVRLLDTGQLAAVKRHELLVRAIHARVRNDFSAEVEMRRALNERYPGEPGILLDLAAALSDHANRDEALAKAEQALAIDPRNPRAWLVKGQILARLKRIDEALDALREADRLFAQIPSVGGRAEVAMTRGYAEFTRQEFADAAEAYREAADLFRDASFDVRLAEAVKSKGDMEAKLGNLAAARLCYQEAIPKAREAGNYRLLVNALSGLGGKAYVAGELDEAERILRQAVEEARSLQNPAIILPPLLNLAGLLNYIGRAGEGRSLAEEALKAARVRKDRRREGYALTLMAEADYHHGQLDRAVQAYRDLIEIESTPGGSQENLGRAHASLAGILDGRGFLAEGLAAATSAVQIERDLDKNVQLGYTLATRASLRGKLGLWDEAHQDLTEAEAIATAGDEALDDLLARVLMTRGALALLQGDWRGAEAPLERALRAGAQSDAIGIEVPALTLACEVAIRLEQPARAVEFGRQAVDHPRAVADERTAARTVLARALAAARRLGEAESEARRALDEAESIGLPMQAARAAALLCSLSGNLPPSDCGEIQRRGRSAMQRYLDAAPAHRRAAVRRRPDLAGLFEQLAMKQIEESTTNGER